MSSLRRYADELYTSDHLSIACLIAGNYSEFRSNADDKRLYKLRLQESLQKKKAHMEKSIQVRQIYLPSTWYFKPELWEDHLEWKIQGVQYLS